MPESTFERLLAELKRRKVFRVAIAYAAVAWVVIEVADTLVPALHLPVWTVTLIAVLALVGFPVALLLAWAFDITQAGVRRDPGPEPPHEARASLPRLIRRPPARRVAWIAAAGILAVSVGAWWMSRDPEDPELSRSAIAVLPFSYNGAPEFAYLGRGMVNLLATNLDGAGDLRAVDPHAVNKHLEPDGADAPDAQRGATIARRFGAGMYVIGSVTEAVGQLRVSATLHDADGTLMASAQSTAMGEEGLFELVDDLTRQLVAARSDAAGDHVARLASRTTRSVEALKAYLEGEHRFESGDYAGAVEPLQRAITADSSFALAYYRLAIVESWLYDTPSARAYSDSALRYVGRLTDDDRTLLQALDAYIDGRADEAERLYRRIVTRSPDNAEAWAQLGETLIHYNPGRGRLVAESRQAFERAIELNPDQAEVQVHLVQLASADGDDARLAPLLQRLLATGFSERERFEATRVFAFGDSVEQAEYVERFGPHPPGAAGAIWELAVIRRDLKAARRLAASAADGAGAGRPVVWLHRWLQSLAFVGGRLRDADEHAEGARRQNASAPWQDAYELWRATLPFLPGDTARIRRLSAALTAGPPPVVGDEGAQNAYAQLAPAERSYVLGLASSRLNEREDALRHVRHLETFASGNAFADSAARALALGVRADLAWRAGRTDDALTALERIRLEVPNGLLANSHLFSLARERFLRGVLLEHAGRDEEALRWLASLPERSMWGLLFAAPTHLRRAEILDRRGETEEAARQYGRFLELWGQADVELQPTVSAARARLARISGERP